MCTLISMLQNSEEQCYTIALFGFRFLLSYCLFYCILLGSIYACTWYNMVVT
ncbi:hypothetical protein DAI22_02g147801 [Oryza sativa Japonica Group]|nr:hypothetical protein DAI22_02g147801 [Oryza sativa Japonica Group]